MRVSSRGYSAAAVGVALALVAAGCSSDGDEPGSAKTGGTITVHAGEPENPLIPSFGTESNGIKVIDALWTGLINYDPVTAKPTKGVAESITTTDAKVYTIKLIKGWKFHDGTEVKAKNFVDAWNWSAYSPNGAQNASFFSDIQGYEDVTAVDPDEDGPQKAPEPKSKTMSGLKAVDDHTLEVTLAAPNSVFQVKIGYAAFMPLPDAFFTGDPKEFGKKPIGNGPLKFDQWLNNDNITVSKFADYKGEDSVKVDKVVFKHYTSTEAAYNDVLSGALDSLEQVPTNVLVGEKWKSDLGEGRWQESSIGGETFVAFPIYDARFKNKKLRQAISLAVDRQLITDKIFNKTREPATSFAPPGVVPGAIANTCEYCKFDEAKAKQLFTEAGGWTGELPIFYNGDASHKDWVEAMANSISKTLGIKAVAKPIPTFGEFRTQINARKMTGMYRATWGQDYPHVENFLNPLYKTGGSSNDGLYSSPELDALLKKADGTADLAAAEKLYQDAEKLVAEDMPVVPMWYSKVQAGFSDKVANARVTPFGELDLSSVSLK